jgi:hypothetical protein
MNGLPSLPNAHTPGPGGGLDTNRGRHLLLRPRPISCPSSRLRSAPSFTIKWSCLVYMEPRPRPTKPVFAPEDERVRADVESFKNLVIWHTNSPRIAHEDHYELERAGSRAMCGGGCWFFRTSSLAVPRWQTSRRSSPTRWARTRPLGCDTSRRSTSRSWTAWKRRGGGSEQSEGARASGLRAPLPRLPCPTAAP